LALEGLARCHVIGGRRDGALATKIKACADDLRIFAEKLEALAVDNMEPRLRRQWKKIKAFLNEETWQK
jgi:hypothetical protein